MAKINLLPWRQELRKEQQRQFLTIMGLSVVLVILGILAVHLQYSRMIGVQESRNAYLTQQIEEVKKQIREIDELANKKDRLLARMEIIQQLHSWPGYTAGPHHSHDAQRSRRPATAGAARPR